MEKQEKKEFGKYYQCIMADAKNHPKMSVRELTEKLKTTHTLQAQWKRMDEAKKNK